MKYTHLWDGLAKGFAAISLLLVTAIYFELLGSLLRTNSDLVKIILAGALSIYTNYRWLIPYYLSISTFLYVRINLHTSINLYEARQLAFLFQAKSDGKWYPLRELASLPIEKRRPTLFKFAQDVREANTPSQTTNQSPNK